MSIRRKYSRRVEREIWVKRPGTNRNGADLRPGSQRETSRLEKARQCHFRRRFQQEELPEVFLCFALLAHSQLEQASHRPGVGIFRIESDDAIVISKSLVEISFLSENEGTIEIGRDQVRLQTYGTVEIGQGAVAIALGEASDASVAKGLCVAGI
jgi:hypothetical protein